MHGRRKSKDREKYDVLFRAGEHASPSESSSSRLLQLQVVTQLKLLQSGFLQTIDLQKSDHHT